MICLNTYSVGGESSRAWSLGAVLELTVSLLIAPELTVSMLTVSYSGSYSLQLITLELTLSVLTVLAIRALEFIVTVLTDPELKVSVQIFSELTSL